MRAGGVQVIPGFHASDHYHLERVVMNDGPATALAAVLLANSTSTLPEDAVEVWDDDSSNAKKASSKDRKPAPGVSFIVAGAQKSSSDDDDAAASDGEADVDAGTGTSATGGVGAGAGTGARPVPLAQGSGFGSMGVVGGHVGASMGGATAEAEGDDQSMPEPSGAEDLDVAVHVQDGAQRVAVPQPAASSSFGSADASSKMITTPNSQVGEAQELTLARTRPGGSTSSMAMNRAAPGPVASASGVRLVTVGSAVSESAWQDLAPNAARAAGAGAGADQSDSERHL